MRLASNGREATELWGWGGYVEDRSTKTYGELREVVNRFNRWEAEGAWVSELYLSLRLEKCGS